MDTRLSYTYPNNPCTIGCYDFISFLFCSGPYLLAACRHLWYILVLSINKSHLLGTGAIGPAVKSEFLCSPCINKWAHYLDKVILIGFYNQFALSFTILAEACLYITSFLMPG